MGVIQPSAEAYARMLKALLPPGGLWRLDPESNLSKLMLACGDELTRVSGRAADLVEEADPRTTSELLPDFERMLALTATGTENERRALVVSLLIRRQRVRPADFQQALAGVFGQDAGDVVIIEHSRAFAIVVNDDREIFRFFAYRNPALPGSYDIDAGQTVINGMTPSHTSGHAIESIAFLCDDPFSLCDRDILGGTAADAFSAATGLLPSYVWAGDKEDVVVGEVLIAVGDPSHQVAVSGLHKNNGLTALSFAFDDGSADAWRLADNDIFDFNASSGPSWLFVIAFRTTGGAPAVARNIYGDYASGEGAEVVMETDGSLDWNVDASTRTLPGNYADGDWHVIVPRWRYDVDEIDLASELESTAPTVTGANVTSVGAATFGARRLLALGCQVAFVAAVSGTQVHDVDISALAQRVHSILVPDIAT